MGKIEGMRTTQRMPAQYAVVDNKTGKGGKALKTDKAGSTNKAVGKKSAAGPKAGAGAKKSDGQKKLCYEKVAGKKKAAGEKKSGESKLCYGKAAGSKKTTGPKKTTGRSSGCVKDGATKVGNQTHKKKPVKRRVYYHATPYDNLMDVLLHGIKPSMDGLVYMCEKEDEAVRFLAVRGVPKVVTFKVKIKPGDEVIETFDHSFEFFRCRSYGFVGAVKEDQVEVSKQWDLSELWKKK